MSEDNDLSSGGGGVLSPCWPLKVLHIHDAYTDKQARTICIHKNLKTHENMKICKRTQDSTREKDVNLPGNTQSL